MRGRGWPHIVGTPTHRSQEARLPRPTKKSLEPRPAIGWREWVGLPGLGITAVKAKVDTGARSSSLHAYDIQRFRRRGVRMVRFVVHPLQRDNRTTVHTEAPLVDLRRVKSSSGAVSLRPVIVTEVELLGQRWEIEITLTRRDAMGFRMLLGRQAIRGRLAVDPGRSFVGGRPRKTEQGT